jgi:hypothetical protein
MYDEGLTKNNAELLIEERIDLRVTSSGTAGMNHNEVLISL